MWAVGRGACGKDRELGEEAEGAVRENSWTGRGQGPRMPIGYTVAEAVGPMPGWPTINGLPGINAWKFLLPLPEASWISRLLYCRPWGNGTPGSANPLALFLVAATRVAGP